MNFLLPFLISFVASVGLTPVSILIAKKYHLVDDPKKRDHPATIHKKIIYECCLFKRECFYVDT